MTGDTIRSKQSGVVAGLRMARCALRRGALILAIDVARRTCHLSMSTSERKTSLVVVHTCASPTGGAVAGSAIGSQSAIVNIIPLVASDASGWGTCIRSIRVTGGTSRAKVISG